jgi:hypothetical protein
MRLERDVRYVTSGPTGGKGRLPHPMRTKCVPARFPGGESTMNPDRGHPRIDRMNDIDAHEKNYRGFLKAIRLAALTLALVLSGLALLL